MTVLLLADVNNGVLAFDALAKTLTAVRVLGDVHILVPGTSAAAALEAAKLMGATKVLHADHPDYDHGLAEPIAGLIVSLAPNYSHIVGAATAFAKNILPRVAALLDVMVINDVTALPSQDRFERPIYAGNAVQTIISAEEKKVLTIRTGSFSPATTSGSVSIERIPVVESAEVSEWIEDTVAASHRPDLTSARIVVSGGRGVGSQADFKLIEALADKLGAAVGASRAAVDQGYAPSDSQVGQTGKVVAPQLYIAIGISGAIQHLAGMKDSKLIVAVNKDTDAPIFQVADYGIEGDLFTVIPEWIAKS